MDIGTEILIKVNGFHDAKDWMYRLIRAGVATCSSCDKPATRIFWQDRAEFYFECDEHYESGDMWTGSTNWNPRVFSKSVIPDKAKAWIETLPPEERKRVKLREYDATDYYELMVDHMSPIVHVLHGIKGNGMCWEVQIYPLTNARFCYELVWSDLHSHGGTVRHQEIVGEFDSEALALEAARQSKNLPEQLRSAKLDT